MANAPAVLIVIPAYTHAGTLRRVVLGALAHGLVLVVNDGSTDMAPGRMPPDCGQILPADAFAADHPLHGLPVHYLGTNATGAREPPLQAPPPTRGALA